MADCPDQKWSGAHLQGRLQTPEFSGLIRSWVMRARLGIEPFEKLIHLWVAFNAWTAETIEPVSLMERDAALVAAAARDAGLNARFRYLLDEDSEFLEQASEFRSLWPVFNVRRIDRLGIGGWLPEFQPRNEYCQLCFDSGALENHMKPECFMTHQLDSSSPVAAESTRVPLDWPHILAAIYQVRCNLFHGGKSFRVPSDIRFVELAFEILWQCWGSDIIDR